MIPTLFGLEGIAARELRDMDMKNVMAENGRVLCEGRVEDIPRMNLRLRTGERVMIALGSFHAETFEELFEGTRKILWGKYIPEHGKFPVTGYSLNSQLASVPSCQAIIKKAVVKSMSVVYHRDIFPEDEELYQIRFSIMKDQVTLMLDTTGPGLYKRGYRAEAGDAPLRETLAAALVLLSGYRGRDPFCDPFCGSGTIAIEAALIAKNRAPGLNRTFSAQKWRWIPSSAWMDAADEAMDLEYDGQYDIWGGDIDPACVALARSNAAKADVEDVVRFEVADARKFSRSEPYGRVVSNPPYGERLMEKEEAGRLYRDFGRTVQGLPEGWKIGMISSHVDFERCYGKPADKKRKLYNGMMKCDFFQYDIKLRRNAKKKR